MFRLSGPLRKLLLLTHILAAGLWLGLDIGLGILVLTAFTTGDGRVAGLALQAVPMFAIWPMFGASVASLLTGAILGLGGKYGLIRYWWVALKLAINVLMSVLIAFALRPGVDQAAALGRRLAAGETEIEIPTDVLFPVFVAPTLLLIAFVLSVYKPRWRLRRR
jgi:hypothetical protein